MHKYLIFGATVTIGPVLIYLNCYNYVILLRINYYIYNRSVVIDRDLLSF
jgi:hypothetical protein